MASGFSRGFSSSFTPPADNIEGAFLGTLIGNCFGSTVDGEALPGELLDLFHIENLFTAETLEKSMIRRSQWPLFVYSDHYMFTDVLSELILEHGFEVALQPELLSEGFVDVWQIEH